VIGCWSGDICVWVVSPDLTDQPRAGAGGTIVSLHHSARGRPHGPAPAVVPTPAGRSRVDLPPHPWLVARRCQGHTAATLPSGPAPAPTRHSAHALHRMHPHTAVRGLCAGSRYPPHGARRATAPDHLPARTPTHGHPPAHGCPDAACAAHGWLGRGPSRAHGPPGGPPWRQLQGGACHGDGDEPHGTLWPGTPAAPDLMVRVSACWAEGRGSRPREVPEVLTGGCEST
jgi:hypothetical protein